MRPRSGSAECYTAGTIAKSGIVLLPVPMVHKPKPVPWKRKDPTSSTLVKALLYIHAAFKPLVSGHVIPLLPSAQL